MRVLRVWVWLALLPGMTATETARAAAHSTAGQQPAAPASQMTSGMDIASYVSELDRISGVVAHLDRAPAEIKPLRQSLPKVWLVHKSGQSFEVATNWLDSALETMETTSVVRPSLQADIQNRLKILRQQAEALAHAGSGPQPDEARARLENILRRREFRSVRGPTWWDQAREWFWSLVQRILRKLFGWMPQLLKADKILVWCVIALAFVVLTLGLRLWLLRASALRVLEIKDAMPPGKSWRDWADQAFAAAAEGHYREAVHAAYWAGIYRLEELGVWQLDRSRTPREYLGLVARAATAPSTVVPSSTRGTGATHAVGEAREPVGRSERAAALAKLTRSLETTWYGYQPASAGDFREAVSQLEALGCRFPSNLQNASS